MNIKHLYKNARLKLEAPVADVISTVVGAPDFLASTFTPENSFVVAREADNITRRPCAGHERYRVASSSIFYFSAVLSG